MSDTELLKAACNLLEGLLWKSSNGQWYVEHPENAAVDGAPAVMAEIERRSHNQT